LTWTKAEAFVMKRIDRTAMTAVMAALARPVAAVFARRA
jgi:hypothetical protein